MLLLKRFFLHCTSNANAQVAQKGSSAAAFFHLDGAVRKVI